MLTLATAEEGPTPNEHSHKPQYEVSCVRCAAVIVVTDRIADAEMRCIVGHLRRCAADLFRASERPTFDDLFGRIRVRNL